MTEYALSHFLQQSPGMVSPLPQGGWNDHCNAGNFITEEGGDGKNAADKVGDIYKK